MKRSLFASYEVDGFCGCFMLAHSFLTSKTAHKRLIWGSTLTPSRSDTPPPGFTVIYHPTHPAAPHCKPHPLASSPIDGLSTSPRARNEEINPSVYNIGYVLAPVGDKDCASMRFGSKVPSGQVADDFGAGSHTGEMVPGQHSCGSWWR